MGANLQKLQNLLLLPLREFLIVAATGLIFLIAPPHATAFHHDVSITPQEKLQEVVDHLTPHIPESRLIQNATNKIQTASDRIFWRDPAHLSPLAGRYGNRVLSPLARSVASLTRLLQEGKVSNVMRGVAQQAINDLLVASRVLAVIMIEETEHRVPFYDTSEQFNLLLDKAWTQLVAGDAGQATDRFYRAATTYRAAFRYAKHAYNLSEQPSIDHEMEGMPNAILNGSFETGSCVSPFTTVGVGAANIASWQVIKGNVDYICGYWSAADVSRSIDMNGNGPGRIRQSFVTIPGRSYQVLFNMAGNPDSGPAIKRMSVSAASTSMSFSFNSTGNSRTAMGWLEKSFTFAATSATTTLTFMSLTDGFYGPALDHVRIIDTISPTIISTIPLNGISNAATGTVITATFSKAMDSSTLTASTFRVSGGVSGTVSYSTTTVTLTPSSNLLYNTTYTVVVIGGVAGVRDIFGNVMATDYTWDFTTLPPLDVALTVIKAGGGSGAVTSLPSGITCGLDCTEAYLHGTVVTLTAVPSSSSFFSGWSGACTGLTACMITMDAARTVIATFSRWQPAQLVETDDTGNAYYPQIAMDGSGVAITVWQQFDGMRYNIWGSRHSSEGWGTAQLIETNNAGDAFSPQIAMDNVGNAITVWSQNDGISKNIWVNRFSAGAWETAQLIETDPGFASDPQIAMDDSGNAIAVWYQHDGTRYNIWMNRFSSASGTWGTAQLIETDQAGDALYPQITMNGVGDAVAVWFHDDGTRFNIWANRFSSASGTWGAAQLIETDNAGGAFFPEIMMNSSGIAIAIWFQDDGVRYNIWANWFSDGAWGVAQLIEADNTSNASYPKIAIDGDGNAVAVWLQPDDTSYNIWANRFSSASGTWGTAQLIETNTGDGFYPQIVMDETGVAIAVWEQFNGTHYSIWSNRMAMGVWGTAQMIESNPGGAANPKIAIDRTGYAMAVWRQYDGIHDNIWAGQFQ